MLGDERAVLDHWVDMYLETTLLKIAGLNPEQLAARCAAVVLESARCASASDQVEAYWLRAVLLAEEDVADYYSSADNPDGDFDDVDPATAAGDVATYQAELMVTAPRLATNWMSTRLSAACVEASRRTCGGSCTHLVEEYARHLGHMANPPVRGSRLQAHAVPGTDPRRPVTVTRPTSGCCCRCRLPARSVHRWPSRREPGTG